ncbi:MAG: DUF4912 domain-containing protein [Polyangiaceae bacterium]|nr:DUF4912 domain-containing protein [Polyangiaceae bacterium]
MERKDLEGLSREELIARAETAGVVRPRALTIPELVDEIVQVTSRKTGAGDKRGRGWFGRARDLLTSVIDRGLNIPEPGARRPERRPPPPAPPPLPTVTLAEIYAAQGHLERAITTLDEVLAREPGHADARALRTRFEQQLHKTKPSTPPPVIEAKLEPMPVAPNEEPAARKDVFETKKAPSTPPTPAPVPVAKEQAPTVNEIPPPPPPPAPAVAAPVTAGKEPEKRPSTVPPPRRPTVPPPVDVDEVVGLAVDPHTVYLYWEVRPATLAHARASSPDGALVVRAVTVQPALGGPETDVRDFRVDALTGELFIHGLPSSANVRISIGYKSNAGFEPFAVAMDLATPREAPTQEVAQTFRKWSEAGRAPRQGFEDATQRALAAQRARSMPDYGAEGSEGLLAKFPAGVWVDPSTRVVRVVGTDAPARQGSDVVSHTFVMRPDGSSELVRKQVVWASKPGVWASNTRRAG